MTHIPAIEANRGINSKAATYNAVKIQINDPRTNIPEDFKSSPEDNGTYNAVAIEVNRPTVEAGKNHRHHCLYDYPCADCAVTSDMAPIHHIKVPNLPVLPVAYQTTNFISNKTLINAEVEVEKKDESTALPTKNLVEQEPETGIVIVEEIIAVPEPNVTTVEEQKAEPAEVSFQGISFKANEPIEIVPPVEIKPDIDIPKVIKNLTNTDFDIQAKQMEEIARVSMEDPQNAVPYIVTEVFNELVNIVKKDSSNLTPPSEKQIEIRKKIIINEIIKEQAKVKGEDPEKIELPYNVKEKDVQEASRLSTMEQAERNKEYALYTMAILAKVYTDEIQRHTGNVVPLTDSPGVSTIVDTIRYDSNAGVKIAAIDALRYLNRPEYKDEIVSVLSLAANDSNDFIARNATIALETLN